ncbi:MAG: CHAT domain-containing protein [Myxococcales bacterium]|nr:CHAT domain-containing protein [Myxococcales bacterium]
MKRRVRRGLGLATLALPAAVAAVFFTRESKPQPAMAPLPMAVEFAGCDEVRAGPVCLVSTSTLTLWVPAARPEQVRIRVDGVLQRLDLEPLDDGTQARVLVTRNDRGLVVEAELAGARRGWRLSLAPSEATLALDEARALKEAGQLDPAMDKLQAILQTATGAVRAKALGLVARVHLARGERPEAVAGFRESIAAAHAAGMVSVEASDRCAAAYTLEAMDEFAEATTILEPLNGLAESYPKAEALRSYYGALVALGYGDIRNALALLDDTITHSVRMGLEMQANHALDRRVSLLLEVGRFEDAARGLEALARAVPEGPPCRRAEALNNLGAFQLILQDNLPNHSATDPRMSLRAATALFASDCRIASGHARALHGLAWAEFGAGDVVAARTHIEEAEALAPASDRLEHFARLELVAELRLAEGEPEAALEPLKQLNLHAAAVGAVNHQWRAAVLRARALGASGRVAEAAAALEEAEELLDQRLLVVPLGEGRGIYASSHRASAALLVDLLLQLGRVEDASRAARRSRRRGLSVLTWSNRVARLPPAARTRWYEAIARYRAARRELEETGEDWSLARDALRTQRRRRAAARAALAAHADEAMAALTVGADPNASILAAPVEGELILAYHPLPTGWVGFAVDSTGVTYARIPELDVSAPVTELATRLLAPLADRIRGASRIRVLAYGELAAVDFHVLPLDDVRLLDSHSVVYGLDLPPRPTPPVMQVRDALVISDPRIDLPGARREAADVATSWVQAGLQVEALVGPEATYGRVYDELSAQPDLLYYAGHAVYAGLDGQAAGVLLANDGKLTTTDVLSLSAAPRVVVLSGCETGKTGTKEGGNLGLAQAFLVAGSEVVVATSRPVRDGAMASLSQALLDGESWSADDVIRRARAGQLSAATARMPGWSAVRVVVP